MLLVEIFSRIFSFYSVSFCGKSEAKPKVGKKSKQAKGSKAAKGEDTELEDLDFAKVLFVYYIWLRQSSKELMNIKF
jgi:hypothetical protein